MYTICAYQLFDQNHITRQSVHLQQNSFIQTANRLLFSRSCYKFSVCGKHLPARAAKSIHDVLEPTSNQAVCVHAGKPIVHSDPVDVNDPEIVVWHVIEVFEMILVSYLPESRKKIKGEKLTSVYQLHRKPMDTAFQITNELNKHKHIFDTVYVPANQFS